MDTGERDEPTPTSAEVLTERPVVTISTSRELAVDRISKGTVLSVFGLGISLAAGSLSVLSGFGAYIAIGLGAVLLGAGAVWGGFGATHLLRFGENWSSLTLLSLVGLGGSILVRVATTLLTSVGANPLLAVLHVGSLAASAFFMAALVALTVVTLVRWLLPDREAPSDELVDLLEWEAE